ncbi:YARHG domain-containing protein [Roseibium alexandrii]|uniref:YARHG domain-containing protein n=1 Tax=Roseibium alexandrii (strain DSM 17067 / NCIMB 14079 / DFL-11) TaxID=244592 RepID=A0A5E8UX21_ROSAD|nr:hypothetical protein SADFL11_00006510 [Roseibium alexandrii DFL-11]
MAKYTCGRLFSVPISRKRVRIALVALLLWPPGVQSQEFTPNESSLGSLTCQQLWYLEQEVLAKARVCLKSQRAQNAFKRAKPCISDEERILPAKVRDYLSAVRETASLKKCS